MSHIARPAPPKPVPKPGHVKVVRALYRYVAQQADELSFEEGDNLYILDVKSDANWWKASCHGKVGLIPSNYVEERTEEVLHPLHEAAKRGNLTFLTECINNKVSVNGLDKAGCTALHWAAHAGNEECVKLLLKVSNIEINVQNKLGDTPLHSCAWKGHSEIVKMLLEKGADPMLKNNENKSAFDITNDSSCAALLKPYEMMSPPLAAEDYGDSDDSE
ncbi:osteoclast-stimulating factor 1 [Nephila pilipes]|uniref:Osteoclast-stimulating factor 1 n=1 Tax=Nephila pilipes TaxID=299642 RepID=A0A8X6UJK9_NEPPI|nr:osteoclast-stimulating factor 1 [Nephila pilipes]